MARTTLPNTKIGEQWSSPIDLSVTNCGECGITFAMPRPLEENARAHPADDPHTVYFYCPAGHKLRYNGESEEQRLERALARERERAGYLAHERDQAEASARAQKGAATRARRERDDQLRKIEKGICPAKGCGRHFKNVRLHMASKHPELAAKVKAADAR